MTYALYDAAVDVVAISPTLMLNAITQRPQAQYGSWFTYAATDTAGLLASCDQERRCKAMHDGGANWHVHPDENIQMYFV